MARQLVLIVSLLPTLSSAASAVAQLSCTDSACTTDCNNGQWNINQCYNTTGGNSQIFLTCDSTGVTGIDYTGTGCTGKGTSGTMDVSKCLVSETGTSFINTCVTADGTEASPQALSSRTPKALSPAASDASAVAQLSCTDSACTTDCNNGQWNINQCYNTTGGNSQIFLTCDSTGVTGIDYTGTGCTGKGTSGTMDVAKCLISETGASFFNTCVKGLVLDTKHHGLSSVARKTAALVM